jgi:hypothetical protein
MQAHQGQTRTTEAGLQEVGEHEGCRGWPEPTVEHGGEGALLDSADAGEVGVGPAGGGQRA